ncbi:hypothetical protein HU200_035195 [Digitaria exilis]|uniref:TFIIS N-terminal domain-containing protein n=1 Tax=Digitaria exilis TaxID=1010633 RepID=A0A835BI46_9POAL|nr:hypothetical protein HU200_035195 [Digitaria exilis]CAB3495459.1 unnamed protein product [Digitaria exilis]
MAGKSPLRRWKPFFPAFGIVDAAIEASVVPGLSQDNVRSARGEVVELLHGVPAADARKAEELCVLLDGFMAEALLTLRAVPVEAVPRVLAASADLAKAVGSLRRHESERVRGLARDVIRGWTSAVEDDIARTSAAMKMLDDVCGTKAAAEASHPKTTNKAAPVAAVGHGQRKMENTKAQAPATNRDSRGIPAEKMEAAKRKLQQGYQEVEDAKRQRKIQEIQAPKMPEQRQRNIVHPILRERSQARSGKSTVVRRCAVSSS